MSAEIHALQCLRNLLPWLSQSGIIYRPSIRSVFGNSSTHSYPVETLGPETQESSHWKTVFSFGWLSNLLPHPERRSVVCWLGWHFGPWLVSSSPLLRIRPLPLTSWLLAIILSSFGRTCLEQDLLESMHSTHLSTLHVDWDQLGSYPKFSRSSWMSWLALLCIPLVEWVWQLLFLGN